MRTINYTEHIIVYITFKSCGIQWRDYKFAPLPYKAAKHMVKDPLPAIKLHVCGSLIESNVIG